MRHAPLPLSLLTLAAVLAAPPTSARAASLDEAVQLLGADRAQSLEYSGTGRWFQFGQAPAPGLPWPPFEVSRFVASANYQAPGARVQIVRKQVVEAGRDRPLPVEQRVDQYLSGASAWNMAPPANAAPGSAPVPSAQPLAVEERTAELWSTPQGFLKAALTSKARAKLTRSGLELSFSLDGKHRYVGLINAKNQLERVRTWIDNPVLGDTLVETRYTDYKTYGDLTFPSHIVRIQGGFPVLDIAVADVKLNTPVDLPVPPEGAGVEAPAVTVKSDKLSEGVYYLTGGTHHSVAIEQRDHIVVVEGPQHEARAQAVIDKVKALIPGKPIRYLVNTHAHFDHSGGVRTFAAEGATIVTHALNAPYYRKVWASPHSLAPDRLARANKPARFETFGDKHVLSDEQRPIEIHSIAGNSHNDAFALIYLPAEKILIEADAYTPAAANTPAPTSPNPYSVNLYDNIRRLKLDVQHIAALHGPRVATMADLEAAIGPQKTASNR